MFDWVITIGYMFFIAAFYYHLHLSEKTISNLKVVILHQDRYIEKLFKEIRSHNNKESDEKIN